MTTGTGQDDTREASRPIGEPEGQLQDVFGPTRIGELVGGKYRISRLLAQGGMGVVYEAQHEIVKRRFAVKFLRPDYARQRESLGRFQREAEAAGALESEHIASAVDFGITADGSPFLVMEYLVGEDLASLLKREGSLPVERAAELGEQACQGAETAHAAGILHRDLKPKNLFVGRREDGTDLLKILDFGIAKLALMRNDQAATDTGTVMGTPAYMSPEQARGERALDARSDVYALGAILYEMLSGRLPHPGSSPNAVLHHISTRPAIPLARFAPGLPSALVEMVDRALATDPGTRPQSAMALAAGLSPFAKRQVWPDRPGQEPPTPRVGEGAEPSVEPSPRQDAVAAPGWRRHRGWRRGVLLTVAAGVAAAVVWGISARSPQTPPPAIPAAASKVEAPASIVSLPPAAPEPTPTLAAAPAAPAPSDSPDPPPVKPSRAKRARASGQPTERPSGRPNGRTNDSPPETDTPSAPVDQPPAPRPEKGSKPAPDFKDDRPYASP